MKQITKQDIQKYCVKSKDLILAHGTTTDCVDDIINDGLLIRDIGHPTVLWMDKLGCVDGGPITDYCYNEPRGDGKGCCVILGVPRDIVDKINKNGLKLNQKNIFNEICEEIELTVPDNEKTREAYDNIMHEKIGRFGSIYAGRIGPKFCKYGAKPGTKYTHIAVPKKYIVAITTDDAVLYVGESVKKEILVQIK